MKKRKLINNKKTTDVSFFNLLCTSWSYQIKEFSEKSTLHGIRYVAETKRPFCERFMWFCFIMAGVAIVTINVASLWDKYQTNPTITGLDMDFHNWDVPFPTVTLCPENTVNDSLISEYIYGRWGDVKDELLEKYTNFLIHLGNISYESLAGFSRYKDDQILPQDNLREIFSRTFAIYVLLYCPCRKQQGKFECVLITSILIIDDFLFSEEFPHCTLKGLSCLADYADELRTDLNCDCELGCKNTVYEVEKIDGEDKQQEFTSPNQPNLIVGFLSWPTVRYKREVLFGWVDLLVAFGGIAGLFLGFSLLSGIEIFYYFTLRALCMVHTDKKKLTKLHWQYKWEKESQLINLDLEPFLFGRKHPKLTKNSGYLKNERDTFSDKTQHTGRSTNQISVISSGWTIESSSMKHGQIMSTLHSESSDYTIPYLP
ncbi:unnamed protein product [Bemisia tabaci]|uniref:Sodium channel protein Nach n=1 Tax=Bemisia tabaci TaxID=7038 RepID=A0A9P0A220_BEMTA|nr:unnamed protein product [Bemisia tabaci]